MIITKKVIVKNEMIITELLDDGFEMIESNDNSMIPDIYFLRDTEIKKTKFKKDDDISISVENVDEIGNDIINKKITLYSVINLLCSAGVYTKYFDEDKGKWHKAFFYDGKGILTLPSLRKGNPFEIGDFIKIMIK